jgi:hypothetical protein
MSAKLSLLACAAAALLLVCTPSGRAEFVTVPVGGFLFPGDSLDVFIPEEPDVIHNKILTFEGNIQNTSFTAPATMEFWFDWSDGLTTTTTTPQTFFLDTIPTGNNFQFFGRSPTEPALTYTIPFCPPEVSLHWRNLGPGGPVSVSGTFTAECVPEPVAFVVAPLVLAMAPFAVRRIKTLAGAV